MIQILQIANHVTIDVINAMVQQTQIALIVRRISCKSNFLIKNVLTNVTVITLNKEDFANVEKYGF